MIWRYRRMMDGFLIFLVHRCRVEYFNRRPVSVVLTLLLQLIKLAHSFLPLRSYLLYRFPSHSTLLPTTTLLLCSGVVRPLCSPPRTTTPSPLTHARCCVHTCTHPYPSRPYPSSGRAGDQITPTVRPHVCLDLHCHCHCHCHCTHAARINILYPFTTYRIVSYLHYTVVVHTA